MDMRLGVGTTHSKKHTSVCLHVVGQSVAIDNWLLSWFSRKAAELNCLLCQVPLNNDLYYTVPIAANPQCCPFGL